MPRFRIHLVLGCVLGAALLPASLAAAEDGASGAVSALSRADPTWGRTRVLGAGWRPAVTVDAKGRTTVVWEYGTIRAATRAPGGHWSAFKVIGRGNWPQVGVDSRGSVTAIWQTSRDGFTTGVSAARRPAGRGWSKPVHLTVDRRLTRPYDDTFGAQDLNLAVNPGGAVLATWTWGVYQGGPAFRIQAAYRAPGGHWSKVVNLTPANGSAYPVAGLDARGNAVLAYTTAGSLRSRRYQAAGGSWTKATTLARHVSWRHAVAVDQDGSATVLFTSEERQRLWTRYHRARGGWGPARVLSPRGVQVDDFSLAMNAKGAARVAYSDEDSGAGALLSRPPPGPWGAPVEIGVGPYPVVALNRSGDTFVAWGAYDLSGRYHPHGGPWGEVQLIQEDRGDTIDQKVVAVAPDGDVVAVWIHEEPTLFARVMQAG